MPSWQALVDRSILASEPNAALMDESAAYQLTHAAMYLTALGTRPPSARVDTDESHRQRISALLVRFVAEQHWDLVGELLLSWSALELGPSPVCEGAWWALLGVVEPGGAVAQPRRRGEREPKPEPRVPFLQRYHTTLVLAHAAESWRRDCAALPARSYRVPQRIERPLLHDVADVEAAWLAGALDESEPRVVCTVLAGLWICGALSEQARPEFSAAFAAAQAIRDWTRVPAGVALVAYGLLARTQAVPDGLAAFMDVAEAALRSSSPGNLALCEKRVLLHRLGRAAEHDPEPLANVLQIAERTALESTAANVERLRLTCESRTAFGTRSPGLAASDGWIAELLLALAAERAHNYDLVGASRLVRASAHFDANAPGLPNLVEVLIANHRSTGGFGLFGKETPAVPEQDDSAIGHDRMLGLSVDCLWTLAEAATPWRLMAEIGAASG
jgi:hypothetical protein